MLIFLNSIAVTLLNPDKAIDGSAFANYITIYYLERSLKNKFGEIPEKHFLKSSIHFIHDQINGKVHPFSIWGRSGSEWDSQNSRPCFDQNWDSSRGLRK